MKALVWSLCGLLNIIVALFHVYVIRLGAPGYRAFGAGEWMATQAERGSRLPDLITWGITGVFLVFAAFNFAGAGWWSLPLTQLALMGITAVYVLRASAVVIVPFMKRKLTRFEVVSSYVVGGIALLHAIGLMMTLGYW